MSRQLTNLLRRSPAGFGLGQLPADKVPTATTRMTCGYCSTGCSLDIHLRDGKAVGLSPTLENPVNCGAACPKGWEALAPLAAPDRATQPMLRDGSGRLRPIDWNDALTVFCDRMKAVQAEHGPDSIAFISTGQIPSEEMAFLGALAKFGMGTKHGDGNTRQCMASSVVAYKQSFGFDSPPYTYADFEESDVVVLAGSNLCVAHPIMWDRITKNPNDPTVIVIDPRRTETAMAATEHVALRPKSDLTLYYGLAKLLIEMGAVDQAYIEAHTNGYDEFASFVAEYTLERVEEVAGIPADQMHRIAGAIAGGKAVSFWWTMGVNQSHQGVRTGQALINLALMTGNIGRPGTGANSITGQCNAMGSRLFSNTTGLMGGYDFTIPEHRSHVAEVLGIDEDVIPHEPSWSYDRIVEGIAKGEIRGLWVIATNGAHSWINHTDFHDLLDRLDFFVVQDLYTTTETAERADLILPAAGWAEKEGTFINSERRLGMVKRVVEAPGQALADFYIFKAIADRWGCGEMFDEWTDPEAAFRILQRLSEGRPCDISGVGGYAHVDEGSVQWPYPKVGSADELPGVVPGEGAAADTSQRRLFADGRYYHPDGRAKFLFEDPTVPLEVPSPARPLVLLTGRGSASQWHTETRTGKSATLRALAPDGLWLEMHPDDASSRGLATGDDVHVSSARGSVPCRVLVVPTVPVGSVFLPMHDKRVNRLTFPAFDAYSRQPSYKYCAVEVRAAQAHERATARA